jgi:hypothetical protein
VIILQVDRLIIVLQVDPEAASRGLCENGLPACLKRHCFTP